MRQHVVGFNKENRTHEAHLELLYHKVFGDSIIETNSNLSTKSNFIDTKWKVIGFQSPNPRTDFRGGGHLSLLCILYLHEFYKSDFDAMSETTNDENNVMWLTAISSINITYFLIWFLHMTTEKVIHRNPRAN